MPRKLKITEYENYTLYAVDINRKNVVGVDTPVKLVAGVFPKQNHPVEFRTAGCGAGACPDKHHYDDRPKQKRAPAVEISHSVTGRRQCRHYLKQGVNRKRAYRVWYFRIDEYGNIEDDKHHHYHPHIKLEDLIAPHRAELAGRRAEYQREIHTSDKHEYSGHHLHIQRIPSLQRLGPGRESSGRHRG